MTSPTQRTIKALEQRGYVVDIAERRITRTLKKDLFGMFDVVAIDDNFTVGVQVTDGSHHANRRAKILKEPRARKWLVGPCREIQLWSWRKAKPRGATKAVWTPRVEEITEEMFDGV